MKASLVICPLLLSIDTMWEEIHPLRVLILTYLFIVRRNEFNSIVAVVEIVAYIQIVSF